MFLELLKIFTDQIYIYIYISLQMSVELSQQFALYIWMTLDPVHAPWIPCPLWSEHNQLNLQYKSHSIKSSIHYIMAWYWIKPHTHTYIYINILYITISKYQNVIYKHQNSISQETCPWIAPCCVFVVWCLRTLPISCRATLPLLGQAHLADRP